MDIGIAHLRCQDVVRRNTRLGLMLQHRLRAILRAPSPGAPMNGVRSLQHFALALGLTWTVPLNAQGTGVSVPTESCMQCKFLPCLKELLSQKKMMISIYQGIRNFWAPHAEYDTGRPVAEMSFTGMPKGTRDMVYLVIMKQLAQYRIMEESRTSQVPAPEGCGFPNGAEIGAATDSLDTCTIDPALLLKAMNAMPCKELANLIVAHESLHVTRCAARKVGKAWIYSPPPLKEGDAVPARYLPPRIITPYGKAAEEMAGYQIEVDALEKMIAELEKRCHPKRDYSPDGPQKEGPYPQPGAPLPSYEAPPLKPPPTYTPKPIGER